MSEVLDRILAQAIDELPKTVALSKESVAVLLLVRRCCKKGNNGLIRVQTLWTR